MFASFDNPNHDDDLGLRNGDISKYVLLTMK